MFLKSKHGVVNHINNFNAKDIFLNEDKSLQKIIDTQIHRSKLMLCVWWRIYKCSSWKVSVKIGRNSHLGSSTGNMSLYIPSQGRILQEKNLGGKYGTGLACSTRYIRFIKPHQSVRRKTF